MYVEIGKLQVKLNLIFMYFGASHRLFLLVPASDKHLILFSPLFYSQQQHCEMSWIEREKLVQSHPAAFMSKVGLEPIAFWFLAWCLYH